LLLTAARRFYLRRPLQLLLVLTGSSLGVAVFVGVDLANDSARRAFEYSEAQLSGRATHQLLGIGRGVTNEQYRTLRLENGHIPAAPVIEAEVTAIAAERERTLTLLGIDPLEELDFRGFSSFGGNGDAALSRLITEPGTVILPASTGAELGVRSGSALSLRFAGGDAATVQVVGTIDDRRYASSGLGAFLITDIATAQELLAQTTLSRIDLALTPDSAEDLARRLPAGTQLVAAGSPNRVSAELSTAFRTNLTALSLLALLVGVFLIYATMSFAVVQRRRLFGIYRALGVPRETLLSSVLLEAGLIGTAAAVLGLLLGSALAQGLVDLTLRTMGDLYFSAAVRPAAPSPWIYAKGFVVGTGTTLLASAMPAFEAMHVTPRAAMTRASLERTARRIAYAGPLAALPCVILGSFALLVSVRSLAAAFFGMFCIIVAAALVMPACASVLLRVLERTGVRSLGIPGMLAVRGVSGSLSRTGIATAALSVAVATVIGVGLMIGSFRLSVERWLEATLLADFYLETEDLSVETEAPLRSAELSALLEIPGVRGLSLLQLNRLQTGFGPVTLRAIAPGPDGWGLTLVEPAGRGAIEAMEAGAGVVISESLAFRNELGVADVLTLPTLHGPAGFTVLGIYRDYNTDGGGILLPIEVYQRHWDDRALDGVGVYITASADPALVRSEITARMSSGGDARVRSTAAIRSQSLAVFDRTFRITEVLRILAGVVAFLGLLSALLSIELDRTREIATLRALGLTPRQVAALSLTQTGLLGAVAAVLSIPLGIVMAELLVSIINRRSFGWGMDLELQAAPLALGVGLALIAAVLAGLYPAYRIGRCNIVAGLREE
jgi:putative ABC transport system permease protein